LLSSDIILIKTITTAVVFIKAEMPPVISIITGRSINRGRVCRFFKKRAIEAITPLSSKAIEIINKERTVMVAELENPEIASSGETKPVKAREAMMKKSNFINRKYLKRK